MRDPLQVRGERAYRVYMAGLVVLVIVSAIILVTCEVGCWT